MIPMKIERIHLLMVGWTVLTVIVFKVIENTHPEFAFVIGIFLGMSGFLYLIDKIDDLFIKFTTTLYQTSNGVSK